VNSLDLVRRIKSRANGEGGERGPCNQGWGLGILFLPAITFFGPVRCSGPAGWKRVRARFCRVVLDERDCRQRVRMGL
jgi:hypothetical protein